MPSVRFRAYEPPRDGGAVLALWDACLGDRWPVEPAAFRRILDGGEHVVAELDGRAIGFAASRAREGRAALQLLMVDPAHRRRGFGRALHDRALAHLRQRGATAVRLGPGGGGSYFWPGVPVDLPEAWAFFAALGWTSDELAADLVLDLADYATPAWVYRRSAGQDATLAPASPGEAEAVVAWERAHLPGWDEFFALPFASGEPEDVLTARKPDGTILGTALLHGPGSRWPGPLTWSRRLGPGTGAVGAVGVAESARDRGVGLALVARATEILQERGLARSYVGWTWLRDWYGKLGYRLWMEYRVSAREL